MVLNVCTQFLTGHEFDCLTVQLYCTGTVLLYWYNCTVQLGNEMKAYLGILFLIESRAK